MDEYFANLSINLSNYVLGVYNGAIWLDEDIDEGIRVRTCSEEEPSSTENTSSQCDDAETIDVQEKLKSGIAEHLKDMFLCSCVNLTDEQSIEFGEVLLQYQDVFLMVL